jgi:sugar (pentulose or hexulose) kinase
MREAFNFKTRLIFKLVGMTDVINMNRKRTIANWLIENEPENWARVSKYLHASTYFIYKLTGLMKNSAADHVGHYPLDYKNRCWYKDPEHHIQGQIFSVKKSMLCELVPEGDPIGPISAEGAEATGLPKGMIIYACGSDKSCETLGTGVIDTSMASISLGTAATIETTSKKWIQPVPLFPAYPACLPDYYNLDIQIYRGYWMINWFLKEFAAQRINDVVVDDIDVNDYNADLDKSPGRKRRSDPSALLGAGLTTSVREGRDRWFLRYDDQGMLLPCDHRRDRLCPSRRHGRL